MPKFSVKLVAALALAGLSLGNHSPASAQDDAGEVTITDSRPEAITESEQLPIPGEGSSSSMGDDSTGSLMMAQGGGYPSVPGNGVTYRHKNWYGYENSGPWRRPIRRPLYRVPVQYARYWPTSYYTGAYDPSARYAQPLPMVYQPTDTTQLGFYHQRVPHWQPRPGAIPGPPWPPQWHYTTPVSYGNYRYPTAQGQYSNYSGGAIAGSPIISGPTTYGEETVAPQETSEPQTNEDPTPAVIVPEEKGPAVPAPIPDEAP